MARNKEELRKYHAEYYQKNKVKIEQQKREWEQKHKTEFREYHAKYRRTHRLEIKDRQRKHRTEHRVEFNEYMREYSLRNKGKRLIKEHKRRAAVRIVEGLFTETQWYDLKAKYGNRCLCCGVSEAKGKLTIDHIIPFSKGGTNWIENIQPLCQSCNSKKQARVIDYRKKIRTELAKSPKTK